MNLGVAFFFLAEAYLNFGPVGPLLIMAFWGLFCGVLHQYRLSAASEPGVMLLYAVITAFFLQAIAGDFSVLVVGLTTQYVAPVVVGLWVATRGSAKQAGSMRAITA